MGSYAQVRDPELIADQLATAGLDCADVARRINAVHGSPSQPQVVSRQFISQLKTGRKKRCTPRLAEHIAQALGVTARALFVMPDLPQISAQHAQKQRAKVPA